MEQLTPIDEEPAEENDEDQPITMIPKIMHTAPSPTTDFPPTSNVTSTTTIHNDQTPKHESNASNVANNSKPPSYADVIVTEATVEKDSNTKQSIPSVATVQNGTADKEIRQIESVL